MATSLYLVNSQVSPYIFATGTKDLRLDGVASWWDLYSARTTRGSGVVSRATNTVVGPTAGIESLDGVTAPGPIAFISAPLAAAVTISGSITFNIWGLESAIQANAGPQVYIDRIQGSDGTIQQGVINSENGTEFGTSAAVRNWAATPGAGVAFSKGDRIRIVVAFNDAGGTMASGRTVSHDFGGATGGADGDSFVTFTEALTFVETDPTGTTIYPTDAAAQVDPNGTSYDAKDAQLVRGSGVATAVTNTAAGPTSPLLCTASAGGNFVEWFTHQLSAFTLSGVVLVHIRSSVPSANNQHVGMRVELAICDSAGANPVIWSVNQHWNEAPTVEGFQEWYLSAPDASVASGSRLRLRVYLDDAEFNGPMGTGSTGTLYYSGAAGATGDTYLKFTQTITEQSGAPPAAPPLKPELVLQAVNRGAVW